MINIQLWFDRIQKGMLPYLKQCVCEYPIVTSHDTTNAWVLAESNDEVLSAFSQLGIYGLNYA